MNHVILPVGQAKAKLVECPGGFWVLFFLNDDAGDYMIGWYTTLS
jgi:hypothetical protein